MEIKGLSDDNILKISHISGAIELSYIMENR